MTWNKTIWIAVALTMAGPVTYLLMMGLPFVAKTGSPIVLFSTAGLILGIIAAVQLRTRQGLIIAAGNAGLALFFVTAFFFGSRVPSSGAGLATGAQAPDFELTDHQGQRVRLSNELGKGPVLLVFYRGHW